MAPPRHADAPEGTAAEGSHRPPGTSSGRGERRGGGGSARRGLELAWDHADLVVLVALLVLTETFGRSFSRVGWSGGSVFVTELALLATIVLVLARYGLPGVWHTVRSRIPLLPLLALWLAGAVAAVRGLAEFGLSLTLDDIGLVEYSILLPLIALVAADRARLDLLVRALAYGGLGAALVFGVTELAARAWGETLIELQPGATGLYASFYAIWIATRVAHRLRVAWFEIALAFLALVVIGLTDQRSVWVAAIACIGAVAVLAPAGRRLTAGIAAALVLAVAGATSFAVEDVRGDPQATAEVAGLSGATDSSVESEEGSNVRWRLDYWAELLERTVSDPVLGAGLGRPSRFTWRGHRYDFRDATPPFSADVTGPHNSFVHVLYRTGVIGFAALLALIGIAAWRTGPLLRAGRLARDRRAQLVAVVAMFVSSVVIAFFNQALVTPFLGMFFWVTLGLLFVSAALEGSGAEPHRGR